MRKNLILFSLLFVAFSMNSCFDNLESHSTPLMMFGNVFVNPVFQNDTLISAKDTLSETFDESLGISYLDTMQLGDTVMFMALFTSDQNNLVQISTAIDTTRNRIWFGVDMENEHTKKALAEGSKPEKGYLLFNPMYNTVTFPIYISPMEVGSHVVQIAVMSDSKYSTNGATIVLPVKFID